MVLRSRAGSDTFPGHASKRQVPLELLSDALIPVEGKDNKVEFYEKVAMRAVEPQGCQNIGPRSVRQNMNH